jgi:hypothetical protein
MSMDAMGLCQCNVCGSSTELSDTIYDENGALVCVTCSNQLDADKAERKALLWHLRVAVGIFVAGVMSIVWILVWRTAPMGLAGVTLAGALGSLGALSREHRRAMGAMHRAYAFGIWGGILLSLSAPIFLILSTLGVIVR